MARIEGVDSVKDKSGRFTEEQKLHEYFDRSPDRKKGNLADLTADRSIYSEPCAKPQRQRSRVLLPVEKTEQAESVPLV